MNIDRSSMCETTLGVFETTLGLVTHPPAGSSTRIQNWKGPYLKVGELGVTPPIKLPSSDTC